MRKYRNILVLVLVFCLCLSNTAFASEAQNSVSNAKQDIIYLENGDYIIITTETLPSARASSTVSGSRTASFYNGNTDEVLWSVTLYATFTYSSAAATCTSAQYSTSVFNNAWHIDNVSVSRSGNTAYCTAVGKRTFLGITMQEETIDVQLSCSTMGILY